MTLSLATNPQEWDAFLIGQRFRPFLQNWTMGEVYREIGQEPVRLEAREDGRITGICFGHVVRAKRGRHLTIPYGPICEGRIAKGELDIDSQLATRNSQFFPWIDSLKEIAKAHRCSFIRLSPFWTLSDPLNSELCSLSTPSPLHLLAEHLLYLPLTTQDQWSVEVPPPPAGGGGTLQKQTKKTEDDIFSHFRATHRNLIRRAQKEGVDVVTSDDPDRDLPLFLTLHEETQKRHNFTPYSDAFFRAQVKHFASQGCLSLYLARHENEVLAASIHVHFGGETSYHHGASTQKSKVPASHLLQWTAIRDALARGDHVYNFWGIAPILVEDARCKMQDAKHPFSGVTLFKTGFGGSFLELTHCRDIPLSIAYHGTRVFECIRKWRRGF